jgi:ketosteroid isomerase-like protein
MRDLLVLAVISAASVASVESVAHASPQSDVTRTFQAFVDAAGNSEPAALELFIPPQGDSPDEHFEWAPLPKDRGEARGYLEQPKVVVKKLAISPSGTSAWLAADIKNASRADTTSVGRADTTNAGRADTTNAGRADTKNAGGADTKSAGKPLRASAFLVKDDKGWHVTAAAWSRAATPAKPAQCKSLAFEWRPKAQVPAAAREPVLAVLKLLGHDFTKAMAPGGVIFGVGAAQPDFGKWKITGPWHEAGNELSARANIAPDGQLAWMAVEVGGPAEQCTDYRAFYVVAKDKGAWRIVHQHYSLPAKAP